MADKRLQCVIVTPEKAILDEPADMVILPMIDGELGVLPRRAALVGRLGKGELRIKPVKVGFAAYYEELGRVGLMDEYGPKGYKQVSISGRELRDKLRSGQLPDPRVMRPATARILIECMQGK